MPDNMEKEAQQKAGMVTKYVAVLLGNFCAISVIYFAVSNEFAMPITFHVFGMWFMIWLICVLLVHMLVRPVLEKRYMRKLESGGN